MPQYRATRIVNLCEAHSCHFSAPDDKQALRRLLSGRHPAWSAGADLIERPFSDEVFSLDRRNESGGYDTVAEEIQHPGQMPYSQPSRDFVWKTARLGETDAYASPMETLAALIKEAQALCLGGASAQSEEIP